MFTSTLVLPIKYYMLGITIMYIISGQKSDDKDSPSYCLSLFSFTAQEMKQIVERDVERWSAAKQRHVSREAEASSSSGPEVDNDEPIDSVVCAGTKRTISMQTELTMTEITALQLEQTGSSW